jgi:hypothetical protein
LSHVLELNDPRAHVDAKVTITEVFVEHLWARNLDAVPILIPGKF